jgi:DNA recombination protein RmuC
MNVVLVVVTIAVTSLCLHIGLTIYFQNNGSEVGTQELKEKLNDLSRQFDSKIGEQTRTVDNKLTKTVESQTAKSQKLIKNITEEITEVKETNKSVLDITESLADLERVLKNQKERGAIGEQSLQLLLENHLPPTAFDLQHQFDSEQLRPDAVIKAKDRLVPVDAKFPLSNYQRLLDAEGDERDRIGKAFRNDLKKRIDETSKYVLPDKENTLNFAFMYIPAEGVYYDLLVNKVGSGGANTRNLIEYAHEKNVVIVSPTTLTAYLHTIIAGLRAFQIEENVEKIQAGIANLKKHLKSYETAYQGVGKHLQTVVNKYEKSSQKFRGIGRDITAIVEGDFELDGETIKRPDTDTEG